MPTPLRLMIAQTVQIARRGGTLSEVAAHRYQEFAVHRPLLHEPDMFRVRWVITHLPTARQVACEFKSLDAAAEAAVEIAKLRNDWAIVSDQDLTPELKQQVSEIVNRLGGLIRSRDDDQARRPEFNGYQKESA